MKCFQKSIHYGVRISVTSFFFFLLDSVRTFLIAHCENICGDCLLIGKLLPSKLAVLARVCAQKE